MNNEYENRVQEHFEQICADDSMMTGIWNEEEARACAVRTVLREDYVRNATFAELRGILELGDVPTANEVLDCWGDREPCVEVVKDYVEAHIHEVRKREKAKTDAKCQAFEERFAIERAAQVEAEEARRAVRLVEEAAEEARIEAEEAISGDYSF